MSKKEKVRKIYEIISTESERIHSIGKSILFSDDDRDKMVLGCLIIELIKRIEKAVTKLEIIFKL